MIDLLLKGGEVIDPSQGLRGKMDIAVKDGAVSQVASGISVKEAKRVINVTGKLVVPGLIDLHCHVYEGVWSTQAAPAATPSGGFLGTSFPNRKLASSACFISRERA